MMPFLYQRSSIMTGCPPLLLGCARPGVKRDSAAGFPVPPRKPEIAWVACGIGYDAGRMESSVARISPDRRQSETALAIARGTSRLLRGLGFATVSELPLPSGRRADLVALNERSEIWIVEIKSSLEDLRADHKWEDYRAHCDRLFFAFTQDLPCEIFPRDTGLIVADAYGAHLHCEAPLHT